MANRVARWTFLVATLFFVPPAFAQNDNMPPPAEWSPPAGELPMEPSMQGGPLPAGGGGGLRVACGPDIARLCRGVPPGGGRIVECLITRPGALSPMCRAHLAAREPGGGSAMLPPGYGPPPGYGGPPPGYVVRVTLHRQLATGRRNPTTPRRRAIGRLRLHRRLGLRLHRTAKRPCTPRADRTRSCFAMVRPGKIRASSSASPRTTPNCLRFAKSTFRTPTRSDRSRLQVRRRCLRVVVSLLPRHRLGTNRNSALQATLRTSGQGRKGDLPPHRIGGADIVARRQIVRRLDRQPV